MNTSTTTRLTNYIRASFPAVAIETAEEQRAFGDVLAAAKSEKKNLATWSATTGFGTVLPQPAAIPDTEDLLAALRQRPKNTVIVFRDAQTWTPIMEREPVMARMFRDLLMWAPTENSCVIFIGQRAPMHSTVEKLITVLDYGLPSAVELENIATSFAEENNLKTKADESVIRALSGFSTSEAESALALAYVETGSYDAKVIYREKVAAVRKSGLLEIVEPDPRGLDAIGGWGYAKEWTLERVDLFARARAASEFGIKPSRGVLVCGVQGAGKSLFGKCVGTALGIPTLRCDIGALFTSLVGATEQRTRETLQLAAALAPVVLEIEEIEKGFAGTASGGDNTGVSMKVLATFLTFLQETTASIFLVATANDAWLLPAPLVRKGRFDEIFFADIPTDEERQSIFEIHLRSVKRDPGAFDLAKLVSVTEGYVGAEIESIVNSALIRAFSQDREITSLDLVTAAYATVPLSRTAREQVIRIREWAEGRAVPVARRQAPVLERGRRKIG